VRPSTQCTARSMSACSRRGSYQVELVGARPFHGARLIALIVCIATPRCSQTATSSSKSAAYASSRIWIALEAPPVHSRRAQPVPGDTDETDEALLARLDRRFERSARTERGLPLDHVDEVVQLEQVDRVDAEPVERPPDLLARPYAVAAAGLRGQEESLPVTSEPRRKAQLGLAVRGGGVDVVHTELDQRLQGIVGLGLGDRRERGRAEDRAGALVARRAERSPGDHHPTLAKAIIDVRHDPRGAPMARQVKCECGYVASAATDDEVIADIRDHIRSDHPELVEVVSDDQIAGWIEIVP